MADISYILVQLDNDLVPGGRQLSTGNPTVTGLQLIDQGPGALYNLQTVGNLGSLASFSSTGFLSCISPGTSPNAFAARSITSANTITVTNGDGVAANPVLEVIDSTSVQKVNINANGASSGAPESTLSFFGESGVSVNAVTRSGNNDIAITISGNGDDGTVTSVGISTSSGLTVGATPSNPITGSGTLTVDLPIGEANQFLQITGTSPQTLGWAFLNDEDEVFESTTLLAVGETVAHPTATNEAAANVLMGKNIGNNGTWTNGRNFIIANNSMENNTTGFGNIGMGSGVLGGNTTGSDNVALGSGALSTSTSGSNNIAIGFEALFEVSGSDNVAIGYESMGGAGGDNANNNIGIGSQALESITTGTRNIAIGSQALTSAQGSADNIGIGFNAGYYNGGGFSNVAIGTNALYGVSTGSHTTENNVAIGVNALKISDAGYQNVAIGANAATSSVSGTDNVAIGFESLYSSDDSFFNVAIGSNALFNHSGAGDQNTAVGALAGRLQTNYNGCTFIGYQADTAEGPTGFDLYNSTAIGANATVAANNAMVLGADVNVGIGISNPAYGLHLGPSGANFNPFIYFSRTTAVPPFSHYFQGDSVLYQNANATSGAGGRLSLYQRFAAGGGDIDLYSGSVVVASNTGGSINCGTFLSTVSPSPEDGQMYIQSYSFTANSIFLLNYYGIGDNYIPNPTSLYVNNVVPPSGNNIGNFIINFQPQTGTATYGICWMIITP